MNRTVTYFLEATSPVWFRNFSQFLSSVSLDNFLKSAHGVVNGPILPFPNTLNPNIRLGPSCLSIVLSNEKKTSAREIILPERPKLPPTPFILYMKSELKNCPPSLKHSEKLKYLAERYKNLSEYERKPLQKEFENNFTVYKMKLADYKNNLSDQEKNEIKRIKIERKLRKQFTQSQKKAKLEQKESGKPKLPLNSFVLFMKDFAEKYGVDLDIKNAAKRWVELPEEEKSIYRSIFEKNKVEYTKELNLWEERMINMGKTRLVRQATLDKKKHKLKIGW